ncbi:hypothetical protein LX32DRAFT_685977 [Colletotrichum zoysiae]|uniref:Uncharacterized protein n=1 Tax=Colletotrichum zoysiae TaxID=1216348 RepID=A0AAD9LVX9_9PEZI|nr:hypothetical protein LX32DRAFT_685977 [Colletotrichum zoysiae]
MSTRQARGGVLVPGRVLLPAKEERDPRLANGRIAFLRAVFPSVTGAVKDKNKTRFDGGLNRIVDAHATVTREWEHTRRVIDIQLDGHVKTIVGRCLEVARFLPSPLLSTISSADMQPAGTDDLQTRPTIEGHGGYVASIGARQKHAGRRRTEPGRRIASMQQTHIGGQRSVQCAPKHSMNAQWNGQPSNSFDRVSFSVCLASFATQGGGHHENMLPFADATGGSTSPVMDEDHVKGFRCTCKVVPYETEILNPPGGHKPLGARPLDGNAGVACAFEIARTTLLPWGSCHPAPDLFGVGASHRRESAFDA